ncbi:KOW domain-containing RNA-binding protein [Intestinibacillus massiliensis]|uniref:KOW domain-containing RNA-binding protein n=1 Tax=Intestinibacillus massiliensis TaxID=1871029 RepID=UPI000B35165C|nr:KOW domain-containing RNA-binding protein [Intestinibacillus massiliensis]MCB6365819.1 KOW domain-containing RNA-binding protein [Intestinibacillus massiliensis]
MESHKSDIVLSLKGRDKGMLLLVLDEDDTCLYLANGRQRRAESPKRKKRAHVSHQGACDEKTREKLLAAGKLSNSDIRKALALWTGETGSD